MIEANKITKEDADKLLNYQAEAYKTEVKEKIDSVIRLNKAKLAYNKPVRSWVTNTIPKHILKSVVDEYKDAGWYFILHKRYIQFSDWDFSISKSPFFWQRIRSRFKKLLHFK